MSKNVRKNLEEITKAKISPSRNVVISRMNRVVIDKDTGEKKNGTGFLIAQQMEVAEDGEVFKVFIKGGSLKIQSIDGVVRLRDALNRVLSEEGYEESCKCCKENSVVTDEDKGKKKKKKIKKHRVEDVKEERREEEFNPAVWEEENEEEEPEHVDGELEDDSADTNSDDNEDEEEVDPEEEDEEEDDGEWEYEDDEEGEVDE